MMKIALVTGASRGIGACIAKKLAKNGYLVIIDYLERDACANDVLNSINKEGGEAILYKCDIRDFEKVKEMVAFIRSAFGRIDLLVNNAGVCKIATLSDTSQEDWLYMVNTNLNGTFNVTKNVIDMMIDAKSGKIINIASIWGEIGGSCEVAYSATKAGIIGLTKALSKELGPSGITVNAIAPGAIMTDMCTDCMGVDLEYVKNAIMLGRLGEPEEVADLVYFLASKQGDYITGSVFNITGGFN